MRIMLPIWLLWAATTIGEVISHPQAFTTGDMNMIFDPAADDAQDMITTNFDFICPSNMLLVGFSSRYVNHAKPAGQGSRIYRFSCKMFKDGESSILKKSCKAASGSFSNDTIICSGDDVLSGFASNFTRTEGLRFNARCCSLVGDDGQTVYKNTEQCATVTALGGKVAANVMCPDKTSLAKVVRSGRDGADRSYNATCCHLDKKTAPAATPQTP